MADFDMSTPPDISVQHVAPVTAAAWPSKPHVTSTWAQSLDAKIAGPGGKRVSLSGPESMGMTQWSRTMHDAILVGAQTVIHDDPRLKIQQVPQDDTSLHPPQILILDPSSRTPPNARMSQEWQNRDPAAIGPKAVKQPFLICGPDAPASNAEALEKAGACIIRTPSKDGRIPPSASRGILTDLGSRSVMIEGGSRVLASFLADREVDTVVVTVAPMFIGDGVGVVPREEETKLPQLKEVATVAMGKDAVMVATLA